MDTSVQVRDYDVGVCVLRFSFRGTNGDDRDVLFAGMMVISLKGGYEWYEEHATSPKLRTYLEPNESRGYWDGIHVHKGKGEYTSRLDCPLAVNQS